MPGPDDGAASTGGPGREALVVSREEARATVDHQIRTINDVDAKAVRVLRVNVVLAGLVLTGVSVAVRSGREVGVTILNGYLVSGLGFLLLSTALAAVTYTASSMRPGIGPDDLRSILHSNYSADQVRTGLIEGYAHWMEFNRATNLRNAPLLTATIVLLVWALGFVAAGVVIAFRDPVPWYVHGGIVTVLFAFTASTGLYGQVRRWSDLRGGSHHRSGPATEARERLTNWRE